MIAHSAPSQCVSNPGVPFHSLKWTSTCASPDSFHMSEPYIIWTKQGRKTQKQKRGEMLSHTRRQCTSMYRLTWIQLKETRLPAVRRRVSPQARALKTYCGIVFLQATSSIQSTTRPRSGHGSSFKIAVMSKCQWTENVVHGTASLSPTQSGHSLHVEPQWSLGNICRHNSVRLREGGKAAWDYPEGLFFPLVVGENTQPLAMFVKTPFPLYQLLPQCSFKNQSMQTKKATPLTSVYGYKGNQAKKSWRQIGMVSQAWNLSSRRGCLKIKSLKPALNA